MNCSSCLKENCFYQVSLLYLPCEDCIYKELDDNSPICKECINDECKFKRSN